MTSQLREDVVQLTGGARLGLRTAEGPLRPVLLVHDAGGDSSSWDGVAGLLSAAGHQVAAVDLRGHGHSESPAAGYDTDTCADDLATLLDLLGFTGGRSPIVVGHGWGANVVLSLAARRDGVAGVCCLGGGWTRPAWRYSSFDAWWTALTSARSSAVDPGAATFPAPTAGSSSRRSIAWSVYRGEPRGWYPLVGVPALLCPVVPPDGRADPSGDGAATRTGVAEALAGLPRARVSWYYGGCGYFGDPALLTADRARIADDVLSLAADAEPQADRP